MSATEGVSDQWHTRADRVIPGRVWGHNRFPAALAPDRFPWFAARGEGPYLWDEAGNRYIDLMCGYGAMISGYANPAIDDAAVAAVRAGETMTLATSASVDLAEHLVDTVDGASWAAWGKNGSDATWTAILVARAHTGRTRIATTAGAYHGSHGWCGWCNIGDGRPHGDHEAVDVVGYNDIDALDALFTAKGEQLAAFMLTPFHHPIPGPAVMPDPDWLATVQALCRSHGVLLVSDDVRAGFRLDLAGSHRVMGYEPDLVCLSKAIANGWPLAAVVGTDDLRSAADRVFMAGTFFNAGSAHAAALANLRHLREVDAPARINAAGTQLVGGLTHLAATRGIHLQITGPSAMPTLTVDGDHDAAWMLEFTANLAAAGTLAHPGHNWFVSTAHTAPVISEALEHAAEALDRTITAVGRPGCVATR